VFGRKFVRRADRRRFENRRVNENRAFDFERSDALRFAGDNIVVSGDKPKITVFVDASAISRDIPAGTKTRARRFGKIPVTFKERRQIRFYRNVSDFARRNFAAVFVLRLKRLRCGLKNGRCQRTKKFHVRPKWFPKRARFSNGRRQTWSAS
jgi:hypothetical protein